jgi:hypothetical protein
MIAGKEETGPNKPGFIRWPFAGKSGKGREVAHLT